MSHGSGLALAAVGLLLVGGSRLAGALGDSSFAPTDQYEVRRVEGWPVRINRQFLSGNGPLAGETLELLGDQLRAISRTLPAVAVEKLRAVEIWVEEDEPHHPCMCYHPDPGWLREHGMNPDKARCVEIADARAFLTWTRDQPWMVLHELAHAFHHQVLDEGFDNPEVKLAFEAARVARRYEKVLHIRGDERRHYALENPPEYFAEGSEALFGMNDFYPFNRAELAGHDPELLALMRRLWAVD